MSIKKVKKEKSESLPEFPEKVVLPATSRVYDMAQMREVLKDARGFVFFCFDGDKFYYRIAGELENFTVVEAFLDCLQKNLGVATSVTTSDVLMKGQKSNNNTMVV